VSFAVGDRVRVAAREHEGHHRAPGFLKGKVGVIGRVHGAFRSPETRAYGGDGLPEVTLYLVGFDQLDLWSEYRGAGADRLYADVYEHWLEGAA
jgi:nitrile hydratase